MKEVGWDKVLGTHARVLPYAYVCIPQCKVTQISRAREDYIMRVNVESRELQDELDQLSQSALQKWFGISLGELQPRGRSDSRDRRELTVCISPHTRLYDEDNCTWSTTNLVGCIRVGDRLSLHLILREASRHTVWDEYQLLAYDATCVIGCMNTLLQRYDPIVHVCLPPGRHGQSQP